MPRRPSSSLFSRAVNLPPRQVETLFLRCVAGLSAKETAALLDANVAAVNSALSGHAKRYGAACRSSDWLGDARPTLLRHARQSGA